jgi:hypothetical protein
MGDFRIVITLNPDLGSTAPSLSCLAQQMAQW